MKLHIAGVNHFDPSCRSQLKLWLERLATDNDGPPAFVATEWDENIFAEVKRQRGRFRKVAQREWPNASSDLLDVLALSLGYEADTHTEIFPNVEVLWLDEGRQYNNVDTYAEGRLSVYKSLLRGEQLPTDSASALSKLSSAARNNAPPPKGRRTARDGKFARLILKRIAKGGGAWAIAVVGYNHASNNQGTMYSLLDAQKQLCKVTIL